MSEQRLHGRTLTGWSRGGEGSARRWVLAAAAALGLSVPAHAQYVEDEWYEHDADTEWWEPADWGDQGYDNVGVWGDPEWTEAGDDDWYDPGWFEGGVYEDEVWDEDDGWYDLGVDQRRAVMRRDGWYEGEWDYGTHYNRLEDDWEYGWHRDDAWPADSGAVFYDYQEADDWESGAWYDDGTLGFYDEEPYDWDYDLDEEGWNEVDWGWDDDAGLSDYDDEWDTEDEGLFDIE